MSGKLAGQNLHEQQQHEDSEQSPTDVAFDVIEEMKDLSGTSSELLLFGECAPRPGRLDQANDPADPAPGLTPRGKYGLERHGRY